MDLTLTDPASQAAKVTVRCARNPGIARKEARVRTECAVHAVQLAIPRANLQEEDLGVLFSGGHWRFCVVAAFLIVVYISRRGLVLGLGHPRILDVNFITQTDGGTVRCRLGIVGVSHRGVRRCLTSNGFLFLD